MPERMTTCCHSPVATSIQMTTAIVTTPAASASVRTMRRDRRALMDPPEVVSSTVSS